MKSKSLILASALAAGLLAQQPAQAALVFNFNYIDTGGLGKGFVDPTLGAARQTALQQSADLLGNYFSSYTGTVTFDVNSEDNSASSTLASAGSGLGNVGLGNTSSQFLHTVVQQKIIHGTDANGSAADGSINWNFGITGGWDLDDSITSSAFDFKSTAMHEILHAMGFTSGVQKSGANAVGYINAAPGVIDYWNTSDQFLTDSAGNKLISTGGIFDQSKVGVLTGGTLADNTTPTGNGAFFNGTNAVAGNGGSKVNIYSHNTFDSGSSIAHLDDAFFSSMALLMEASTVPGQGTRTLSDFEIGYLKDIGYTQVNASPVPVPAAVWLMGSGLMTIFGIGRKRKVSAS